MKMKNSIILMFVGFAFIIGGLLIVKYWIVDFWFLLVPIGGLVIFIQGGLKFIKNLEDEKD